MWFNHRMDLSLIPFFQPKGVVIIGAQDRTHAGVVKSVLRLFDELLKCDNEGILKDVRSAVEGK
jgi:hypothetical protein